MTLAFAATNDLALAALLAALLGGIYTLFFVSTNILIQTDTEDGYRGRVMAIWSLNRFAFAPLSALLIGALAAWISVPATLIVCAVCGFLVIGAYFARIRSAIAAQR
ncbi:MFS transporter [bacterium]|nr:MFS transporter [bacterium]